LQLIPKLFFRVVIIFGAAVACLVNPALRHAGEERDPAVLEQIRRHTPGISSHFNTSIGWRRALGNLGESMRLKEPVADVIAQKVYGYVALA